MENEKLCTKKGNCFFKTIAISKIVFQLFITVVPKHIIKVKNTEGFSVLKLYS